MSLHKGTSKKDLSKNIAIERDEGKPEKEAIAIAFSEQRVAIDKRRKELADRRKR